MIKEKGIKVGREFKVFKVWKGVTNARKWCFFLYSQSERQVNGNYENGIKYTIWVENEEIIDQINTPTSLYLQEIKTIKPVYDQFNKLGIEIRAIFSLTNSYQPNQNNGQNVTNPQPQQPMKNKSETTDFGFNSSTDDFDFGL